MDFEDGRVFAVRCKDYGEAGAAVGRLVEMMGGMGAFVSAGESIALKVNLLLAAEPEKAVTTHPSIVSAVGKLAKEAGAAPFIVDSPGGGYKYEAKVLERTYRKTGLLDAAEEAGIGINRDTGSETVSFPEGRLIKRFEIITPIVRADGVFNLCKLKTHMFTAMTGAVKNHFGVIPGLNKPGYHAKLRDTGRFAAMLLDLTRLVSARLYIMDAVVGMEGEGPMAGEPRRIGWLFGSKNPVAMDAVAGEVMGLARADNPVLVEAEKMVPGPSRVEDVELIGVERKDLRAPGFKPPATYYGGHGLGGSPLPLRLLMPLFKDAFSVRPRVNPDACVACGVCVKACPMEAIHIVDKSHALIDDKACIRCYCCHEMCPEKAIGLKKGFLYRLLKPAGAV